MKKGSQNDKISRLMQKVAVLVWTIVLLVGILGVIFPLVFFYSMQTLYLKEQAVTLNLGKKYLDGFLEDRVALLRLAASYELPNLAGLNAHTESRYKGAPETVESEYRSFLNGIRTQFPSFRFFALLTPDTVRPLLVEPFATQMEVTDIQYSTGYEWRDWARETKNLFAGWDGIGSPSAHVSDVFISHPGDIPAISVSVGIPDEKGLLSGILYGNIVLNTVEKYLESLSYGKSGVVSLVDSNGVLIARSGVKELHDQIPGDGKDVKESFKMLENPMIQNARNGIFHSGLYTDPKSEKLVLASYVMLEDKNWIIVVQQEVLEAFSFVKVYLVAIVVLVFVSVFGTLTLFLYMGKEAQDYSRRHRELEYISETDPLTGLLNRRSMLSRVGGFVEEYNDSNVGFVIIMFDIDDFKKINDKYGHIFGDIVLREVAARSVAALRVEDLMFRWGGEEFLVVIRHSDLNRGRGIAEKIRRIIADTPVSDGYHSVSVFVTLGVSSYTGVSIEDMILRADQALYEGKRTGKNCVIIGT